MRPWTGVAIVAALLALGWVGYTRPDLFPGNLDIPGLVWGLMALLAASGAGFGFWRFRYDGKRALGGLLFWAALIVAIALAYRFFN